MTDPTDPGPPPPISPPPTQPPTPIVSWAAPQAEAGPAPGVKFASHGLRLIAYIIDGLILSFVFSVVLLILAVTLFASAGLSGIQSSDFRDGTLTPATVGALIAFGLLVLVLTLVAMLYYPFFWARSGQTPGMMMFGLYVVRDSDGGKISVGQAILRLIGMLVATIPFYLGFIWIFIDARRRGWHDLIAGTVVIERTAPGR